MATTVSYSASMRTRKTNSASNAKSSAASQEYYENTYNYVGIVHFAGMALSGKVITGISLRIVAAQAGYGTGHTKTVYVRKSNYQSASQSGITGLGYCGDALGTFTGAFYGNTSTYTLSGDLLNNLAAYIAAGNNTICLYNPSPVKSSQGYSTNYLQWSECTITVTYEEAASKPTLNKYSLAMGTAVTIYTNRQSSIATHTIRYSFLDLCANTTVIEAAPFHSIAVANVVTYMSVRVQCQTNDLRQRVNRAPIHALGFCPREHGIGSLVRAAVCTILVRDSTVRADCIQHGLTAVRPCIAFRAADAVANDLLIPDVLLVPAHAG